LLSPCFLGLPALRDLPSFPTRRSSDLLCGCAQHRLIVPEPNPVGAPVTAASNAFFFGAKQPRTVAECPSNAIDEVRIHQNIGQSDRKSTRLNSSHVKISYAVFCLKKKK